ncbi:MAG: rhodanese-like domain-containing protein [Solobacterium sp.]|jgi:rhodanese-related sulfurtransferase|nr:rhodanese-like domain-containing protein [Solobacterium sp.]MCH4050304.1 rhodanese-like domain-containing protein [Solobacterium sp.]MCH4075739.1 rhodanese-like domain-containing protein [Solobacterium sp.]MCI1312878.1 rhodanese-like domain-containing protein [Solobacterium sp.]MCI1345409.1 rhodanese-like domain-containing protein [Solobacterium sp.]
MFQKRQKADINEGYASYQQHPGAYLIDVRESEEFAEGHLPGAVNVPLSELEKIRDVVLDEHSLVYLYCRSGVRAEKARRDMNAAGYDNVYAIGGVLDYKGQLV